MVLEMSTRKYVKILINVIVKPLGSPLFKMQMIVKTYYEVLENILLLMQVIHGILGRVKNHQRIHIR